MKQSMAKSIGAGQVLLGIAYSRQRQVKELNQTRGNGRGQLGNRVWREKEMVR